jgi:hypothetical protein
MSLFGLFFAYNLGILFIAFINRFKRSVKNVAPLKTVKIKDKISVRLKRLIKAMNKIPKLSFLHTI